MAEVPTPRAKVKCLCLCGCGGDLSGRRAETLWADPACRKRAKRDEALRADLRGGSEVGKGKPPDQGDETPREAPVRVRRRPRPGVSLYLRTQREQELVRRALVNWTSAPPEAAQGPPFGGPSEATDVLARLDRAIERKRGRA
jgi:hypothetical protein